MNTRTTASALRPSTDIEVTGMLAVPQTISPQFSSPHPAEATPGRSRDSASVARRSAPDRVQANRVIARDARVDLTESHFPTRRWRNTRKRTKSAAVETLDGVETITDRPSLSLLTVGKISTVV
jgi:hypothetical protein